MAGGPRWDAPLPRWDAPLPNKSLPLGGYGRLPHDFLVSVAKGDDVPSVASNVSNSERMGNNNKLNPAQA